MAVLLAAVSTPAQAQILYGGLVGNVTDATGAVIPDAKVTISNDATGTSRSTQTNQSGIYNFPTVATGSYTVSVTANGFRTFIQTRVMVTVNNVTRVNIRLEVGQVTEQVTVEAAAVALQTDRAEVRAEVSETTLKNIPIPGARNYQMLLGTLPGFSPPRNAHTIPANPTRSVRYSVNGAPDTSNNVRIDGASSYNSWLPHMTAFNPAVESIETVNVVTNAFDAEQGLAGGAAVNVQIKSGTNDYHGSAFWYNTLKQYNARPYFDPRTDRKPKFVFNQFGATLGGPMKKDKIFFFFSFEGTRDRQNASRTLDVPNAAMRQGDLSGSDRPVYDPFTGAAFNPADPSAFARDRTAFPNNQIPASRFSTPSSKIIDLGDWPLPNIQGAGAFGLARNWFGSVPHLFDRNQFDNKVNFNLTDKWTSFVRLSQLDYKMSNPAPFGRLGGRSLHPTNSRSGVGWGPTWSGTISSTYVVSPTFIIDGYTGYTLQDTNATPPNSEENVALELIGIPGTNGEGIGGMARTFIDGFDQFGYPQVTAIYFRDPQWQYAVNGNWTKGNHNVRFGMDYYIQHLNQEVWQGSFGGPFGGFRFRGATTELRGSGEGTNDFNSMGSFLLGTAREAAHNYMFVDQMTIRSRFFTLYLRDQWQMTPKLTVTYGTRWEYYPFPRRSDRGFEQYQLNTNEMLLCGNGSVPTDCGYGRTNNFFAPRLGIAYRASDTFVIRSGFGMTYDPINFGRNLRNNYPLGIGVELPFDTSWSYSTTLDQGLPGPPPDPGGGADRLIMPTNISLQLVDDNAIRGYLMSWNFTMEKQLGNWIASAGYVANRTAKQLSQIDANWADLGTGQAGRQLVQRFGRTAATTYHGHLSRAPKYDSLQMRLQRQFAGGYQMNVSYTWGHSRGFKAESSFGGPLIDHPAFWDLNYSDTDGDIRHNLQIVGVFELPFGRGKRWAQSGPAAAVFGGWQLNTLTSFFTGTPVTPTSSGSSLNAPGSSQRADCLGPVEKLGSPDLWWSPDTLANPNEMSPGVARFGTCGRNILRTPGVGNVDLSVFRKFQATERVSIQFRAELFNITNTPHFGNPNSNRSSGSFGVISGTRNTGREGVDQRSMRLGLRIGW